MSDNNKPDVSQLKDKQIDTVLSETKKAEDLSGRKYGPSENIRQQFAEEKARRDDQSTFNKNIMDVTQEDLVAAGAKKIDSAEETGFYQDDNGELVIGVNRGLPQESEDSLIKADNTIERQSNSALREITQSLEDYGLAGDISLRGEALERHISSTKGQSKREELALNKEAKVFAKEIAADSKMSNYTGTSGLEKTPEEFLANNPNASDAQLREFTLVRKEADLDNARARANLKLSRTDDSFSDKAVGAGAAVLKTVNSIAEGAVYLADGAAEAVTLGNTNSPLDQITGYKGFFDAVNKGLSAYDSEVAVAQKEIRDIKGEIYDVRSQQRIEANVAKGDSVLEAELKEQGGKFLETLDNYSGDYTSIGIDVISSLPYFAASALSATAAMTRVSSKALKEAKKRFPDDVKAQNSFHKKYMSSKAGKAALRKAGVRAGIGATAMLEGTSAGAEARKNIEQMPLDQLRQNARFVDLEKEVGTEEAINRIANQAQFTATVVTGLIAGTTSAVTGADEIANSVLTKLTPKEGLVDAIGLAVSKLSDKVPSNAATKVAGKTVKGAGAEAVEETIQNSGGEFSQNLAEGVALTEDTSSSALLEGTGAAAAEGLIVGAASGGAISGVPSAVTALKGATVDVVEKGKDKVQEKKDKNVPTQAGTKNFDSLKAFNRVVNETKDIDPADTEAYEAGIEKINEQVNQANLDVNKKEKALADTLSTLKQRLTEIPVEEGLTEGTPEYTERVKELYEQATSLEEDSPIAKEAYAWATANAELKQSIDNSTQVGDLADKVIGSKKDAQEYTENVTQESSNVGEALSKVVDGTSNVRTDNPAAIKKFGSSGAKVVEGVKEAVAITNSLAPQSTSREKDGGVTRKKTSDEVSDDIFNGSKDGRFVGVKQYVSSIQEAASNGSTAKLSVLTNRLQNWSNRQGDKLAALDAVLETNQKLARNPESTELQQAAQSALSNYQTNFRDEGDPEFKVVSNTYKFRERIAKEATAINAALSAGKELLNGTQSKTDTSTEVNEQAQEVPATPTQQDQVFDVAEEATSVSEQQTETVEIEDTTTPADQIDLSKATDAELKAIVDAPVESGITDEQFEANSEIQRRSQEQETTANDSQLPNIPLENYQDDFYSDDQDFNEDGFYATDIIEEFSEPEVDQNIDESFNPESDPNYMDSMYESYNQEDGPSNYDLDEDNAFTEPTPTVVLDNDSVEKVVEEYNSKFGGNNVEKVSTATLGESRSKGYMKIDPKGLMAFTGKAFDVLKSSEKYTSSNLNMFKDLEDNFIVPFTEIFTALSGRSKINQKDIINAQNPDGNPLMLLQQDRGKISVLGNTYNFSFNEAINKAAAIAVMEFITFDLQRLINPTEADIKAAFKRDSKSTLKSQDILDYPAVAGNYNTLAQRLGNRVLQISGISFNGDEALNTKDRMSKALGDLALSSILKMDSTLEGTQNSTSVFPKMNSVMFLQRTPGVQGESKGSLYVVPTMSINKEVNQGVEYESRSLNSFALKMQNYLSNTGLVGMINTYIGDGVSSDLPKSTPSKVSNKKRGTFTTASKERVESTQRNQDTPYVMMETETKALTALSRDTLADIFGFDTDFDNKSSIEAAGAEVRNTTVQRTIDHLFDLVNDLKQNRQDEGGLNAPLYFLQKISGTGRTSMRGGFNPQGNKIIRHMMAQKEWAATIDIENDSLPMDMFKLAVMEALGKKVHSVSLDKTVDSFDELYKVYAEEYLASEGKSGLFAAIDGVQNSKGEQISKDLQDTFANEVRKGEEKAWSMGALIALKQYHDGKTSPEKKFTTSLFREIDGVNNGVMLSTMHFFGADSPKELFSVLNRVGVYEDGSKYESLSEFLEDNNEDAYENAGVGIVDRVNKMGSRERIAANSFIQMMGKSNDEKGFKEESIRKVMRPWLKSPLMVLIYGASMFSIKMKMYDEAMEKLQDDLITAAFNNDKKAYAYRIGLLNSMLPKENNFDIPYSSDGSLDLELTKYILENIEKTPLLKTVNGVEQNVLDKEGRTVYLERTLKYAFTESIGEAFESVAEETYGTLLDNRSRYMAIMGLAHDVYTKEVEFRIQQTAYRNKKETKRRTQQVQQKFRDSVSAEVLDNLDENRKYYSSNASLEGLNEATISVINKISRSKAKNKTAYDLFEDMVKDQKVPEIRITQNQVDQILKDPELLEIAPILKDYFSDDLSEGTLMSTYGKDSAFSNDPSDNKGKKFIAFDEGSNLRSDFSREINGESGIPVYSRIDLSALSADKKVNPSRVSSGNAKSVTSITKQIYLGDPGTRSASTSIFGADSAVQIEVQNSHSVTNLYDAVAGKVTDTADISSDQNKFVIDNTLNNGYNIYEEGEKILSKLKKFKPTNPKYRSYEDMIEKNLYYKDDGSATENDRLSIIKKIDNSEDIAKIKSALATTELRVDQYSSGLKEGTYVNTVATESVEETPVETNLDNESLAALEVVKNNIREAAEGTSVPVEASIQAVQEEAENSQAIKDAEANTPPQGSPPILKGRHGSTMEGVDAEIYGYTGPIQKIAAENTQYVFDKLHNMGNIIENSNHEEYLRDTLDNIINKVLKPVSLVYGTKGDSTRGEFDAEANKIGIQLAEVNGSRIPSTGLSMSAQEIFVHELLHKVFYTALNSSSPAVLKMQKLYDQVKGQIAPEDFMPTDSYGNITISRQDPKWKEEYEKAEERYNYIFRNTDNFTSKRDYLNNTIEDTRNPYLHEFAAFGLSNANFMKKLQSIAVDNRAIKKESDTAFGRIVDMLNKFLARITGATLNSNSFDILEGLAQEINRQSEGKKTAILENMFSGLGKAEKVIVDNIIDPIKQNADSKLRSDRENYDWKSPRSYSDFALDVVNLSNIPADVFRSIYRGIFNRANETARVLNPLNGFADLLDELFGGGKLIEATESSRRVSKRIVEFTRKAVKENLTKNLRESFGDSINKDNEVSVTKTVLYTDVTSLLDSSNNIENRETTYNRIKDLMKDPVFVKREIARVKRELVAKAGNQKYSNFYINGAKNTAMYTQTMTSFLPDVSYNAFQIASLTGTDRLKPQSNYREMIPLIDELITLESLDMTAVSDRQATADLMDSKSDEMLEMMLLHKSGVKEAQDKIFEGQENLMIKGYTPQLNNQNISLIVVPESEMALWKRRTYVDHGLMKTDPADGNEKMHLMVSQYHKESPLESGAISLTNLDTTGTSVNDRYIAMDGYGKTGVSSTANFKNIVAAHSKGMNKAFDSIISDTKALSSNAMPVKDSEGYVSDYRYVMSREQRRRLLGAKESFVDLIAANESKIVDKANSVKANEANIKNLKELYESEVGTSPRSFVLVGPNATDKNARNVWNMIPNDTKRIIEDVWDKDGMYVHQSAWKHTFGQKKLSVTNLEYINDEGLNTMKRIQANANNLLTYSLNNKYGIYLEGGWQSFVKLAKDNIVVKGIEVLAGNIISNQVLLSMKGVNPIKALKWQKEAYQLAKNYEDTNKELVALELIMRKDPIAANNIDNINRVGELKDRLSTNKLRDLYVSGVYQSVADEIFGLDEDSIYVEKVNSLLDPIASKLNPKTVSVFKEAALTHDSESYTVLRQATQLSDFVARYALHQHNLEKNGDTEENRQASIQSIMNTFIDYDTPTTPALQYANDMGLLWFTKYLFRVQRVIRELFVDRPVIAGGIIALQAVIGINVSDITDSPIWDMRGVNSPLDVGNGLLTNHPLYYMYEGLFG